MFQHLCKQATRFRIPAGVVVGIGFWFVWPGWIGWAAEADEMAPLKARIVQLQRESKWVEALPLAEKLVTITATADGENNAETAEAIHLWAWLVQQNGALDKAEELWLRALAIDERLFGKDTLQTTRRLHLLANLYRDEGEYEKAVPLLQRALAIRERDLGPDHTETANVLFSLGRLLMLSGDFAAAEANLLRSLQICEKAGPYYLENLAGITSSLGWLYLDMADFEKADAMISRSLELRKKLYTSDHIYLAGGLRELALLYSQSREFNKAEALFQQSLEMRERLFGTNHVLVSEAVHDCGTVYLAQGDLPKAERALERARTIIGQTLGRDHLQFASILMELSRVQEAKGDYPAALKLCDEASFLFEKHLGPSHHRSLLSLRRSAFLTSALGRPERALAAADRLEKGEECVLANLLSFTSERQRLALQRDSSWLKGVYDLWADLGATKPLARSILRTKGIVLDSLIEDRCLAKASNDERVHHMISQISQMHRRLAEISIPAAQSASSTNLVAELRSLSSQVESLEGALARRVAGLGNSRHALSIQTEQVEAAIPPSATLLEIVRYRHYLGQARWEESYGALVLSHSEQRRWVRLGPADRIEKAIRLYQHAVRTLAAPDALNSSLHDLHDRLWRPLQPAIPKGTSQVIVSPDGEMNFVSFAGLLNPANRFLGEDFLFSYVSCSRDLLIENSTITNATDLLVFANPEFSNAGLSAAPNQLCQPKLHELKFQSLPGAEKEGRLLLDRARQLGFERAVLHLGTKATEAALRQVHSPKALHLATHGFVLPEIQDSRLMNEDFNEPGMVNLGLRKMNPMLRCGLAFSGAQRTFQEWVEGKAVTGGNDGVMTADEIGGLDLHDTLLVVLSACDTGMGEARAGEGVLGLRRGFIQAGARNLLLTLWPIDDEQMLGFIPAFYAAVESTGAPAKALAIVQRTWLQKLRLEKGTTEACRIAGPFVLSFQGKP